MLMDNPIPFIKIEHIITHMRRLPEMNWLPGYKVSANILLYIKVSGMVNQICYPKAD